MMEAAPILIHQYKFLIVLYTLLIILYSVIPAYKITELLMDLAHMMIQVVLIMIKMETVPSVPIISFLVVEFVLVHSIVRIIHLNVE